MLIDFAGALPGPAPGYQPRISSKTPTTTV